MSINKRKKRNSTDEWDSDLSDDDYFIDDKNNDTSCSEAEDNETISPDDSNDDSCKESEIPLHFG